MPNAFLHIFCGKLEYRIGCSSIGLVFKIHLDSLRTLNILPYKEGEERMYTATDMAVNISVSLRDDIIPEYN
jgi:hypothetical protein